MKYIAVTIGGAFLLLNWNFYPQWLIFFHVIMTELINGPHNDSAHLHNEGYFPILNRHRTARTCSFTRCQNKVHSVLDSTQAKTGVSQRRHQICVIAMIRTLIYHIFFIIFWMTLKYLIYIILLYYAPEGKNMKIDI